MTDQTSYDRLFYERHRSESLQSAEVILPLLTQLVRPTTCIDIGCGIGTWLFVAQKLWNSEVVGVDGKYVSHDQLLISLGDFHPHDLTTSLPVKGRFDLAMCMEVIEHLPPTRGASLIHELCSLSDVVLFSGAIPYQGGTDHVNEQWPSTWVDEFSGNGYRCFDLIRPFVWADEQVAFYYRQNSFVAVRESNTRLFHVASEIASNAPVLWNVVHPAQAIRLIRQSSGPISLRRIPQLTLRSLRATAMRRVRRAKPN